MEYHVQAINYNNFTIRVVDPGVNQHPNCSSLPRHFLSQYNFSVCCFSACSFHELLQWPAIVSTWILHGAIAGDLKAKDFEIGCHVKLVAPTSWWGLDTDKYSYTLMHRALVYGFEISWMRFACEEEDCGDHGSCYFDFDKQKSLVARFVLPSLGKRERNVVKEN